MVRSRGQATTTTEFATLGRLLINTGLRVRSLWSRLSKQLI